MANKIRNPTEIDIEHFKAMLPKITWIFKGKVKQGFKFFSFYNEQLGGALNYTGNANANNQTRNISASTCIKKTLL